MTVPKRLVIVALPPLDEWPELAALKAQGHLVLSLAEGLTQPVDLILGPQAWHMTDAHRKFLPMAIAAARRIKYPPKKGVPDDAVDRD